MRLLGPASYLLFLFAFVAAPTALAQAEYDASRRTPRPIFPPAPTASAKAFTYDLIQNGSFESGVANPWTVDIMNTNGSTGWFVTADSVGPVSGRNLQPASNGLFQAVVDQLNPGTNILSQVVTIPAGSTATLSLVLWYDNQGTAFSNPASLDYNVVPNQQLRIDLMDLAAPIDDVEDGILLNLLETAPTDPLFLAPTTLSWDVSALAGRTVRLRIAEVDNQFFFNVGVDFVRLTTTVERLWATVTTPNAAPVSVYTTLGGEGGALDVAQRFGGVVTQDATIQATLHDALGNPVPSYPGAGLSLETSLGGLVHCFGNNVADSDTDANGQTEFRVARFAGGFTRASAGEQLVVSLDGLSGPAPGLYTLGAIDRRLEVESQSVCTVLPATQTCFDQSSMPGAVPFDDIIQCGGPGVSQSSQTSNLSITSTQLLAQGDGTTLVLPVTLGERQRALSRFEMTFTVDRPSRYSYSYELVEGPDGLTTFLLKPLTGVPLVSNSGTISEAGEGKLAPGDYLLLVESNSDICNSPQSQDFSGFDFSLLVTPVSDVLYNPRLLATSATQMGDGMFHELDTDSGVATSSCSLPWTQGATSVAFDPETGDTWVQASNGFAEIARFNEDFCVLETVPRSTLGYVFNGLEYIDGVLYGAAVQSSCGLSELRTVDTTNGASTLVGATNFGPISGLAWDPRNEILYGVTGCHQTFGPSTLLILDIATGAGTPVGNTGVTLGGLAVGADGRLYGGGANADGGNLYEIDRNTAAATLVGPTGLAGVTGLALVSDSGIDIQFNSADISGDGVVNLVDVGAFSADLVGTYNYRSDYFWDGSIDLADVGPFSSAIGEFCPALKAPLTPAVPADGMLGIYFDRDGKTGQRSLRAGESAEAFVLLSGPAAEQGIDAWQARISSSENVVVEEWLLPPRSQRFGEGSDLLVGTGGTAQAPPGQSLQLARLRFHVTDERPAHFFLTGTETASSGETPAVVASHHGRIVPVATPPLLTNRAAASINAGGPGREETTPTLETALHASPNPFNPATQIRFQLQRGGNVHVRILDGQGRTVRQLSPGILAAGAQSLRWDGTDNRRAAVGSGLYYVHLQVDGRAVGEPLKIALLK